MKTEVSETLIIIARFFYYDDVKCTSAIFYGEDQEF